VSGASSHHLPALRVSRLAVLGVFFANGVVIGTWVVRIPAVKERLGLGEGLLGLALLGAAVGALAAMPLVGAMVSRFGSRRVVGTTALLLSLSLIMPALAPNLFLLVLVLMLLGAANGGLDVSMNAQAVAVERGYGRPIMSSFHAAWSFGGLAGAALGGLLASIEVGPLPHFFAVAILSAIAIIGAYGARQPLVALVGFACAGAGFSIVFPAALSAAGRTEGIATGPALAAVSTAAYTGFLVGPPFIGFLAEMTGLGYALYLVVALSVAVVIFGGAVKTGGGKAK
jgi:Major Facilitator Superfamily